MRRLSDDMDRLFEGFLGSGPSGWPEWPRTLSRATSWPEIEVSQKGDKLIVQADVPGLKKEDVNVEVRDNELCISGERRSESERTEGGYYQSERSYGSFCRVVPLPEGAKPDTTSATFKDGVLRVEIEAPETRPGRRIEVR
jgi:HSP20 family protein